MFMKKAKIKKKIGKEKESVSKDDNETNETMRKRRPHESRESGGDKHAIQHLPVFRLLNKDPCCSNFAS